MTTSQEENVEMNFFKEIYFEKFWEMRVKIQLHVCPVA
jgi:hypothetical protein